MLNILFLLLSCGRIDENAYGQGSIINNKLSENIEKDVLSLAGFDKKHFNDLINNLSENKMYEFLVENLIIAKERGEDISGSKIHLFRILRSNDNLEVLDKLWDLYDFSPQDYKDMVALAIDTEDPQTVEKILAKVNRNSFVADDILVKAVESGSIEILEKVINNFTFHSLNPALIKAIEMNSKEMFKVIINIRNSVNMFDRDIAILEIIKKDRADFMEHIALIRNGSSYNYKGRHVSLVGYLLSNNQVSTAENFIINQDIQITIEDIISILENNPNYVDGREDMIIDNMSESDNTFTSHLITGLNKAMCEDKKVLFNKLFEFKQWDLASLTLVFVTGRNFDKLRSLALEYYINFVTERLEISNIVGRDNDKGLFCRLVNPLVKDDDSLNLFSKCLKKAKDNYSEAAFDSIVYEEINDTNMPRNAYIKEVLSGKKEAGIISQQAYENFIQEYY